MHLLLWNGRVLLIFTWQLKGKQQLNFLDRQSRKNYFYIDNELLDIRLLSKTVREREKENLS